MGKTKHRTEPNKNGRVLSKRFVNVDNSVPRVQERRVITPERFEWTADQTPLPMLSSRSRPVRRLWSPYWGEILPWAFHEGS